MFAEISASNVMLMELNFQPELKREINSLATQMNSTASETVVMCLRQHFCLPVPSKWRKDSWIMNKVEIITD